jgi:2-C-methyl-D-erythritol 4-phosphate cytidylyltransferase
MGTDERRVAAIVLAAGAGQRIGDDRPKAFLSIGGRPMLALAAAAAAASSSFGSIVVAAPAGWEDAARDCVGDCGLPCLVVTGGESRQASVRIALEALDAGTTIVAIHDAARPFASPDLFRAVVEGVSPTSTGVVPVVPVTDTVKQVADGRSRRTLDRDGLAFAQTPQAFDVGVLAQAHRQAAEAGVSLTDDAAALERLGIDVAVVEGDPANVKITTALDLAEADSRLGGPHG